jgi:translation initiation factor IF-3
LKHKTIKLTVNIAVADLERKCRQVQAFSAKGLNTTVSLTLKGRQRLFKEKANQTMDIFIEGLSAPHGVPTWNGLVLSTTVAPTE